MKHEHAVSQAFGPYAEAYLTSTVHAAGVDLERLSEGVAATGDAIVLDLGAGAGHASFAVAPAAREVIAYDLTPQMLELVASVARDRGFRNIRTRLGSVEELPFADQGFDWVISRYSAHHWTNVPRALAEVRRVLKPDGQVRFIDSAGAPEPLLDTHLQALELLRDASHVRSYTVREWLGYFHDAGFSAQVDGVWRVPIEFQPWISRIGTSAERIAAIGELWAGAPVEVRTYFGLEPDLSFQLDALMIGARRVVGGGHDRAPAGEVSRATGDGPSRDGPIRRDPPA
jgi:ubiquinone/menaquinone biosynthesis C-methylase UbiE